MLVNVSAKEPERFSLYIIQACPTLTHSPIQNKNTMFDPMHTPPHFHNVVSLYWLYSFCSFCLTSLYILSTILHSFPQPKLKVKTKCIHYPTLHTAQISYQSITNLLQYIFFTLFVLLLYICFSIPSLTSPR